MMIGDKLRAERERQNLSIKDIEKGTSIRSLYIDAIEKGAYDTLPGEVYAKGFVRNYANFLKMDADAAVKQFVEENHPEQAAPAAPSGQTSAPSPVRPAQQMQESSRQAPAFHQEPRQEHDFVERVERSHHRQTLWMGLAALLVVLVGGYFLLGSSEEAPAPQPQKTVSQPAAKQPAPQPEEKQQPTEVKLAAKFNGRCWVSVKADGKTLFEGTIEKGETKEWTAQQRLTLTAGNAGAVTVTYNDEDQGVLGKEGEVVEKTYRLDGAEDADGASAAEQKKK